MIKLVKSKAIAFFIAFIASTSAHATIRVLDFDYDANGEKIKNGQIIDEEYKNWGVTIGSCNTNGPENPDTNRLSREGYCGTSSNAQKDFEGYQVAFDTMKSGTADPDLEFDERDGKYYSESNKKYKRMKKYKSYYSDLANNFSGTHEEKTERKTAWKRPGKVLILDEYGQDFQNNRTNRNNGGELGFEDCNLTTGICSNPDDEGTRGAGFFVFDFKTPVDILSLDFFDIELEESELGAPNNLTYFFFADSTQQTAEIVNTGNGGYQREKYQNMFNVTRLVVSLPGSGAINNLVYRQVEVSAPATLGLFLSSLIFVAIRRRLGY